MIEGAKRKEITAEDNIETFAAVVDKLMGVFASLRIPAHFLNQDEMLTYLHSCVSDNARVLKMPKHNLLLDNYLYDMPIGYPGNSVFGMFDKLSRYHQC